MTFDDETERAAAVWFAAQRRGLMALEERQAFDAWRADPLHQAALNHMHELWGEVSGIREFGVQPAMARRRPARRAGWLVAGLVGALCIGLSGYWFTMRPDQMRTGVGEQRTAELSDGSVMALNVVSHASYDMGAEVRRVRLDNGEATFFVHKDPARPFLVTAGGYEIRAVGTAFNVLNRDKTLEVAVKEGVVTVRSTSSDAAPVRLVAGQRLRLDLSKGAVAAPQVSAASTDAADEWRLRVLSYEDAPLNVVLRDLNRFYDRPVVVEDPALANRRVTLRLKVEDRPRTLVLLTQLLDVSVTPAGDRDLLEPHGTSSVEQR